jgi:hypothetical protein
MNRFLVLLLAFVILTTPVVVSARGGYGGGRGGGWGPSICLGLGILGLFGLAASQPPPVYTQPVQCLERVPVYGYQWDPSTGRNMQVIVGWQQVLVSCR